MLAPRALARFTNDIFKPMIRCSFQGIRPVMCQRCPGVICVSDVLAPHLTSHPDSHFPMAVDLDADRGRLRIFRSSIGTSACRSFRGGGTTEGERSSTTLRKRGLCGGR